MNQVVIICLLIVLIFMPGILYAGDTGRYQVVVFPTVQIVEEYPVIQVFLFDTQEGHIWTWMQSAKAGVIMLLYQGKLRPGKKMGDLIEHIEIFDDKKLRAAK